LAMAYPLAFLVFWRATSGRALALALGVLWILYAGLIVVFSVHSNAGLILAMLITLGLLWKLDGWRGYRERLARLAILAAGWIVIALFFSLDLPANPHRPCIFRQAFASNRLAFGWESRVFIWDTTLEMIRQKPWLGVGAGNFEYRFPSTHSPLVLANPRLAPMAGSWTNAAHNDLLQSWAELGVAGPALLLLLFILTFIALSRGMRPDGDRDKTDGRIAALAALAAFAVDMQMSFPLEMAHSSLILMMIAGLSIVLAPDQVGYRFPDLCFEYDWGRLTAELATFRRPGAIRMEPRPHPRLAIAVGLLLCLPLVALEFRADERRLASDIEYRRAAEARDQAYAMAQVAGPYSLEVETAFGVADERFRRALALWPNNHDCRSAYSEMLVREGRGAEALEQISIVMKRLNAWELHLRKARALWEIGDRETARREAKRAFDMKPAEAARMPRLAAWAMGKAPASDGLAAELQIP
ncbi:MAG: O-antigen ligase family protein, partial [Candidatus Sumerlaeota bacterium]|nr:O-antigen ligase family protein [Candidatus Sumerlaeota bacterium]